MKDIIEKQPDAYGEDLPIAGRAWVRGLFIGLGWLSFATGMIGILLPLLPTTPFVILAAACFARGSKRFYRWIIRHPIMGPYLKVWREERRIPKNAKILAVSMIVLTLGSSVLFLIPLLMVKLVLIAIGLCVIAYILHFPS